MLTIWKYELRVADVQKVEMPTGAQLLHVAGQRIDEHTDDHIRHLTAPMLWAKVDTDAPRAHRLIGVVGTGNPAPADDEGVYVGSALCGPYVWHVYDGGEVG